MLAGRDAGSLPFCTSICPHRHHLRRPDLPGAPLEQERRSDIVGSNAELLVSDDNRTFVDTAAIYWREELSAEERAAYKKRATGAWGARRLATPARVVGAALVGGRRLTPTHPHNPTPLRPQPNRGEGGVRGCAGG